MKHECYSFDTINHFIKLNFIDVDPIQDVAHKDSDAPTEEMTSLDQTPMHEPTTSSDSEEDLLEELPVPVTSTSHNRGRRTSVSAESMAPTNEPYEKIVIPKSAEQTKRIELSIVNNFLFKSLDEDQHADVIGGIPIKFNTYQN